MYAVFFAVTSSFLIGCVAAVVVLLQRRGDLSNDAPPAERAPVEPPWAPVATEDAGATNEQSREELAEIIDLTRRRRVA